MRNHTVNKFSAYLAATGYQFGIGRRNHYNGDKPYVLGKAGVFFFVALELFFGVTLLSTIDVFFISVYQKFAFYYKKGFLMTDVLAVNRVKVAFAHGQVVHGIQQTCFAGSVIARKAVYLWRKLKVGLGYVAEVNEGKGLEVHSWVMREAKLRIMNIELI